MSYLQAWRHRPTTKGGEGLGPTVMKSRKVVGMRTRHTILLLTLLLTSTLSAPALPQDEPRVSSVLEAQEATGELFVRHEFTINAPLKEVWAAFTTAEGWKRWVCPAVEVDLRVGGTVRTHYTPGKKVGDPGTNTLRVVNYVPERFLTLQAEVRSNFPALTEEDQKRLFNVVEFQRVSASKTRVISHGIGYRDIPRHRKVLTFFNKANAELYGKLIQALERGR